MKIQYERRTMKTRWRNFPSERACFAFTMGVAAVLSASAATAAPILFPFTDGNNSGAGSANLLHLAFDSQDANGTRSATIEGLLITSVNAGTPLYVDGGTEWTWNGTDYSSSTSVPPIIQDTNISGSGTAVGLGINNPSIGGSSGTGTEGGYINAGEFWTIQFDQPVTFNEFELSTFDGSEAFSITVGSDVYNFGQSDSAIVGGNSVINSASSAVDTLFSLLIPANTEITFSNSNTPPSVQLDADQFSSQFRLRSFTVTPVPEPSHMLLLGIGSVVLGFAKLRRRK